MPLARIDIPQGQPEGFAEAVADVVYYAMLDTLDVPEHDRFQVVSEYAPGRLIVDKQYLGIQRSDRAIIIQVTLNAGRTVKKKKAFYAAVADGIHERTGLAKADVVIGLVEVPKENWSFGNGEAQYA